ncbi:MAG: aminotransferase class I/II-fold pyridoxal phosphate-dependent enzyme, partial [bacterium]|nr:aminotransferase class I/II-fold pyridoxal phosphate-dependent enzyme [bacterium]
FQGMTEPAAKALEDKTAGRIRGTISGICTQSQYITLYGIQDPNFKEQVEGQRNILKSRAHAIKRTFAEHPEWEEEFQALPFNSGYFMCMKLTKADPERVRKLLREEYDIGILSLNDSIYGGLLRIALSAVPEKNISEVYENLFRTCKTYS